MNVWFKKFYPKHSFDGDNEFYHQDYAYHKDKVAKIKNTSSVLFLLKIIL